MWVEGRAWKGDAGAVKGAGPVGGQIGEQGWWWWGTRYMFIKLSAQWTENGFIAG